LKPTDTQLKETDDFFKTLDSGQVINGRVTNIKDFGVFVDIGHNIEGLVHISELSWTRVRHPSDIIAIGDEVRVFILGVSSENKRISLGMKQLQPDPWLQAKTLYEEGQIVSGVITRITTFGAFFELSHGIEGLIHISKLSSDRVVDVHDIVQEGKHYKAKIIKFFPDRQKIGLSLVGVTQADSTPEPAILETAKEDV
jgi:ribosomal protein S1